MAVGVSYFAESPEGKIYDYRFGTSWQTGHCGVDINYGTGDVRVTTVDYDELVIIGGLIIMSIAGRWTAFFGLGKMRFTMRRVGSISANVHRA
jgi:hypothetical protein